MLYRLKIGEVVTTIPTIGFNVESVTYRNLNFNVWDLGGQTSIRPYWRCYYANTAAVVFVVDSTDIERLETAATELSTMLKEDELRDAALLVFANKQDQPGAQDAAAISKALQLGDLKDRDWTIMMCSAITGTGVNEGMDWLAVRLTWLTSHVCSLARTMLTIMGTENCCRGQIIATRDQALPSQIAAVQYHTYIQVIAIPLPSCCDGQRYRYNL